MRIIFTSLVIIVTLLIATPTIAADSGIGRYTAILIGGQEEVQLYLSCIQKKDMSGRGGWLL